MFAFLYLIIPICLFFCTLQITATIPLACLLAFIVFALYKNFGFKPTNISFNSALLILSFLVITGRGGFVAASGLEMWS